MFRWPKSWGEGSPSWFCPFSRSSSPRLARRRNTAAGSSASRGGPSIRRRRCRSISATRWSRLRGAFAAKPYWLALAQCGGIYFKLNVLYTDIAVHARVVKPDPKVNAEYTKKLNDAIDAATVFFDGATRFLMDDRGIERDDAVLIYDGQSRAAGERAKTIDEALAAARSCPALYAACQDAHAKECSEPLTPNS